MLSKRSIAANLLHKTGFLDLDVFSSGETITIFCYHRLKPDGDFFTVFDENVFGPTVSVFHDQVNWLNKNASLLSEADLLDILHKKLRPPKRAVMITFDDGYQDNYSLAFPVLRSLKVPGLFFIMPDAIDNRCLGWWDLISYFVKCTEKDVIDLRSQRYVVKDNKKELITHLQNIMKTEKAENTVTLLSDLSEATGIMPPPKIVQSREILTWEQIFMMKKGGMTFGSHCSTHRVLSTLSPQEQKIELADAKTKLEAKLNVKINSVAYPVGAEESFTKDSKILARKCGYNLAFSFISGINNLKTIDHYDILRLSSKPDVAETSAAVCLPNIFS